MEGALHDTLGIREAKHSGLGGLYFAVFELGRGFVSMFLYAMMRPYFRPGPKTAALAGVVAWIAFSVTGPAQFIPLGFFSNALLIKLQDSSWSRRLWRPSRAVLFTGMRATHSYG